MRARMAAGWGQPHARPRARQHERPRPRALPAGYPIGAGPFGTGGGLGGLLMPIGHRAD